MSVQVGKFSASLYLVLSQEACLLSATLWPINAATLVLDRKTNHQQMLKLPLLLPGLDLRESEPVTNGLIPLLSIVLRALSLESGSTAMPLSPLLAALSNIPGFFVLCCASALTGTQVPTQPKQE